jgi:ATP-dependent Lon protease
MPISLLRQAKTSGKNLMERANKCYEMMHEDFRKLELRNQIHQKTSKILINSRENIS